MDRLAAYLPTLTKTNICKMQQQQQLQKQNNLKKKRSFKRRRLMTNTVCLSAIIFVLMTHSVQSTQAVPALVNDGGSNGIGYWTLYNVEAQQQHQQQQHLQQPELWFQRYKREVGAATLLAGLQQQQQPQKENLKDNLQLQSSSTEVSLEQPQGQCLLDGEYVPETTVFCEKQVGCRAIQKTGHCCPDYKCDCQKDGKTYLNGDKLVDPETPCTVCYCQGGEILCSSVTCFHRDDCTPKYIPGVCCPEYDNCPVATSESSLNKTLTTTTSTTSKPEIHQAENNPKITIKEITKPIEIRITDDNKAIPIHQMLKPSTTSTTTTTTTTSAPLSLQQSTTTTPNTTQAVSTTAESLPTTTQTLHPVVAIKQKPIAVSVDNNPMVNLDKSSIDNGNTNKNGWTSSKGGINGGNGDILKLSASVAYPTTIVANGGGGGSTETSTEVEDPIPALSVFSTQGLPEDPSKVNIKREYLITTEGVSVGQPVVIDGFGSGDYGNTELIYTQTLQGQAIQAQSSAEIDPDTAGSDNIYHIILTTDGPRLTSTSENYLALKGVSTTEVSSFEDLSTSSLNPNDQNNKLELNAESSTETVSKTSTIAPQQHLDDEDSVIPLESNPAYPSLPEDDFSLRDNNFQITDSDDIGDEPRSIGGSHSIVSSFETFKATKHLEEPNYGSGSGSGNGMILEELPLSPTSSTEGSGDLQQSKDIFKNAVTPKVLNFMYSAEDSSEETKITNSTDFKIESSSSSPIMKMYDSLESTENERQQVELEIGSGSGEIKSVQQQKQREPTTPRPNKNSNSLDIDEIQDASGNGPQDDPKLDVESLKVEETLNDSPLNTDKSSKNNALSVKEQPSQ